MAFVKAYALRVLYRNTSGVRNIPHVLFLDSWQLQLRAARVDHALSGIIPHRLLLFREFFGCSPSNFIMNFFGSERVKAHKL